MSWFQKTDGILCNFQTKPPNNLKFTHCCHQCCKNIREECGCGKGSKLLHSRVCPHIISFFPPLQETIQNYLITAVHVFTRESLCEITQLHTFSHNTRWRNTYTKWPFPIACRHPPWGTASCWGATKHSLHPACHPHGFERSSGPTSPWRVSVNPHVQVSIC